MQNLHFLSHGQQPSLSAVFAQLAHQQWMRDRWSRPGMDYGGRMMMMVAIVANGMLQLSPYFRVPCWAPLPNPPSPPPPPPHPPPSGTTQHSSSSSSPRINTLDVASLTADQLDCLCLVLENYANFAGLSHLLSLAESSRLLHDSAQKVLLRAKAVLLFHRGQFGEFKEHIRANQFPPTEHAHLQRLWNEAHYAETEQQRGKRLDPVSRYRVRKKNGFPASIWDGEGTSYCFKKSAREILRRAYQHNPIPSQQHKAELAKETQLNALQVSNWFKNQRQRARQHQRQQSTTTRGRRSMEDRSESEECAAESDGAESEEQPPGSSHRPKHCAFIGHFAGANGTTAFGWEEGRKGHRGAAGGDLAKSGNVYLVEGR